MPPFLAGQRLTAAALNHMYGSGDATTRTVTAASETLIPSQYVITANDAAVGVAYRLSWWGNGTEGSSAQTLAFRSNIISGAGLAATTIASGFASTNAGFRRWARMTCRSAPRLRWDDHRVHRGRRRAGQHHERLDELQRRMGGRRRQHDHELGHRD